MKIKDALVLFSKEIAQAVTGMTAGVMNYLGGRPKVSKSIHLFSFLIEKSLLKISVRLNNKNYKVTVNPYNEVQKKLEGDRRIHIVDKKSLDTTIPLFKIAYARSGDKGDHANIGVIARKEYLPYIQNALTNNKVSSYFQPSYERRSQNLGRTWNFRYKLFIEEFSWRWWNG